MMPFEINVRPESDAPDLAAITLRADGTVLTRLLRSGESESCDHLIARPAPLAFWLIDNWWRLRWECLPPDGTTASWRLAHDLSSVGGGHAWPRLLIWGEDERVGLYVRGDPVGVVGPVRYLTTTELVFVPAADFEVTVDQFLRQMATCCGGEAVDQQALSAALTTLNAERGDPEISDWRRLEARLGYDPDSAPDALMFELGALAGDYGTANVEEVVMAAPGMDAARFLREGLELAYGASVECDFSATVPIATRLKPLESGNSRSAYAAQARAHEPPWLQAERDAQRVRLGYNVDPGPLRNKKLGDILRLAQTALRPDHRAAQRSRPYGLRLRKAGRDRVALLSVHTHARRFELARALGDAIWADGSPLGPIASSRTARQKYQRAFAQSLLCPYDDLRAYMNTDRPTEPDIEAAARHFHVSERVIRTVLVNKGTLSRRLVGGPDQMLVTPTQLDGFPDAA